MNVGVKMVQKKMAAVLYHYPCHDGVFAALAAHLYFSANSIPSLFFPNTVYSPITINQLPLQEISHLYLLDFTGPPGFVHQVSPKVQNVVILDHHKTAIESLGDVSSTCKNVTNVLDIERSGATIAYDYFTQKLMEECRENCREMNDFKRMRRVFEYIEDADIWKWKLPESKAFNSGILDLKIEYDFNQNQSLFQQLLSLDHESVINRGKQSLSKKHKLIHEALEQSYEIVLGGDEEFGRCLAVNADEIAELRSELGNQLAEKSKNLKFRGVGAVIYRVPELGDENKLKISLRSVAEEDTTPVSQKFGGGGHKNASSFLLSSMEFEQWKVVLATSIVVRSGKVLHSRQYVDMSRIRIEGLLAAFPKLVGMGKQHTYIEAENVRYVYQPIESLFLLLLTTKQSNILEDLATLTLLSKLVPEFSMSLDEEGIGRAYFDLTFAFDEVISLGYKESVTVAQVKQYCEMESHEEKLHKLVMQSKINDTKDVMKRKANEIDKSKIEKNKPGFSSMSSMGSGRLESSFNDLSISSGGGGGFGSGSGFGMISDVEPINTKPKDRSRSSVTAPPKSSGMKLGMSGKNQLMESLKAEGEDIIEDVKPTGQSRAAAPPPTDPFTLTVEEKLNVALRRDGGLSSFDMQGTLSVQLLNQEDGFVQVQIETGGNPEILFKTHPNINRDMFNNENILGLKRPDQPFPTGQGGDGVCLLRWRMQRADESMVPLTINCWPSVSGNETYVSLEYEASSMFDLTNVIISVPLPALREAPSVRECDGEWRYDPRNSVLEWSILLIDNSNRSGSMEFVVPPVDSSVFFPISVQFAATSTYSGLKVTGMIPLRGGGGASPRFVQRTQLIAQNYQVV